MRMDKYSLAKEFADDLKWEFSDTITSIILFGSVGKGRETNESDIDLLIISKKHIFKYLKEPIAKILKRGVVPEVINLSVSEFDKMKTRGSPFYFTILEEGVKIA